MLTWQRSEDRSGQIWSFVLKQDSQICPRKMWPVQEDHCRNGHRKKNQSAQPILTYKVGNGSKYMCVNLELAQKLRHLLTVYHAKARNDM